MKKNCLLLLGMILLCACAKQPAVQPLPEQQAELDARWQRYAARTAAPAPYRLQMSLRFGTEGDTRRVTAVFWGNSSRELRLDVMAGVGAVVAKILEDGQHFLVYSPGDNKAYFHQGANKPLLQVGVPVPFNLEQLADLLNGRYAEALGGRHVAAALNADGTARYDMEGRPGGSVTLNGQGLPVAWREHANGKGWTMEILYTDDGAPLPRRLNLTHSNGKRAVVLVKEREKPAKPFSREQLALSVPETAPLLPLSKFKQQ
ncbi:MAG: hypothetical protein E7022_06585 [Desulfovibrio desulfuricans]|jgi:outer membrane biogenesis lipoprotein LolB|nr:hypothetical protein [Desulfovibrio desulfuricans]